MYIKSYTCNVRSVPMARSLCCGLYGAVPPSSETRDPAALLYGGTRRAFVRLPEPDPQLLQEIKTFAHKWVRRNLTPIYRKPKLEDYLNDIKVPEYKKKDIREGDEFYQLHKVILDKIAKWHYNTSINDWIKPKWQWNKTSCPFTRAELRLYQDFTSVGEFAKAEYYPAIKPTRGINASGGGVKSQVGPYFHEIEKQLFSLPWFIKKVPATERPDVVLKMRRPDYLTQSSDFSSFEGSFTRIVQEAIEYELYDYMFPNDNDFKLWNRTLISPRFVKNKYFRIITECCRMSGETNTSLGNGFSNLMLMLYALEKHGNKDIKGLIEGDDGLFNFRGPGVPTDFFEKLGFKVKLLKAQLNTASFCGMIFDFDNKIVMADPYYALASSGFSFSAVGASKAAVTNLTCAKGLSLMYQYAGCPLLAAWGLRMYKSGLQQSGVDDNTMKERLLKYYTTSQRIDQWERDKMLTVLKGREAVPIKHSTRLLFEQLFGMTPEYQEMLEREFVSSTGWYYSSTLIDMYNNFKHIDLEGNVSTYSAWTKYWMQLEQSDKTPVRLSTFCCDSEEICPQTSEDVYTFYRFNRIERPFQCPSIDNVTGR